ncbi:MAG: NAD(P)H-dependent oxidoreductase subunit E, partial [Actinomycetota bacterium]|nr:NAD(P)H-dependent oxidoreductase subunit E [Actinomycetota bacterium]
MKTRACNCENNTVTDDKVEAIVGAYEKKAASLIPVLQAVQEEYGYVPEAAVNVVGRSLGLSASQIFGVTTFYKQFRLTPQGKHLIKVCHGTACHVAGAEGISVALRSDLDVEDGGTTADMNFTLEPVA